ncbi:histidine phosphatase family protein [Phaeacidiphilus oryzae]|uniref:histidine phosphatase family protein n=1 Tax=Phaeacidiphilus oryzae TaxID=348818 RepID=UPI00055AB6A5|nr:histidine phosphatase family protein [Phaeacidiphilus oryzae]
MGELVLIRHGETEWSRSGQHTGWTDLPLTAHGEQQARALRPLLAGRRIARVLASPLGRAQRTAELAGLTPDRVKFETTPDLHEWDYGGYEGVSTDEIHRTRPDWYLWTDGVAPGPPDHPGETVEEVGARVDRVLAYVGDALADDRGGDRGDDWGDDRGGDVVLVAHSHVLRVLTARRLGLPASAGALFRLDTAALSTLGLEHGRPVVTGWNIHP